jgi:CheY-like chemotaxis protein
VQLPTILVIDDNPDVVGLFRRYLRRDRYRLVHAGPGRNVVKVASELRPDAITLDLMMPTQDGWEILQQLRAAAETHAIPIIVCSVLPEKSLARSLGVTDFLSKPVSPESLRSALERCRKTRA